MATTATPTAPSPAKPAAMAVPAGAARMQSWYVDAKGRHVKVAKPVPVTADDRRTKHQLGACGKAACTVTEWVPPGDGRYCSVHGTRLVVASDGRGERGRALAKEARLLHGASALPWLVLTIVAAAGGVAVLAEVPAWQVAVAAPVAYGAGYGAGLAILWKQAVKLGRVQPGQKTGRKVARVHAAARRVGWHGLLSVVWVAAAAQAGLPTTLIGQLVWALLPAGWAVQSYPWWVRVDARRSRGTPQPAKPIEVSAEPQHDPVAVEAINTWATRIGQVGGPLAGTELVDVIRLPGVAAGGPNRPRRPNFTATVRAQVAGSINMRASRPDLVGRIAAAYRASYGDVSFAADPNDLSIAYLRVCPDNPLAQVRMYAGPSADDWVRGWSGVGVFDDGEPLIYAWWTEIGAIHDLISGCTGSGKSELVLQLILRSLHSGGLVMDWLGDPQSGQSYGAVKDQVAYFAPDKNQIRLMLIAAVKEMDRRTQALVDANIKTWRATLDMPLIVITLDEVQRYIDDAPIVEMIQNLVGQGRKAGIKMRLITQVPAAYALGGTIYVKDQLAAGQSLTFRAGTELGGRHASDDDDLINPAMLPKRWGKWTCGENKTTAGLCFVRGVFGRDLFARVDYTGDDTTVWLYGKHGNLTTSPGQFSPEAQAVSGVLWSGRWDRAQLVKTTGRDDASLLTTADAAALIAEAQMLASVGYDPARMPTPGNASGAGATARDLVHAAAARAADGAPDGLATRQTVAALVPGVAQSTRDGALTDLVATGALERVKPGVYRVLKPAPDVALPDDSTPEPAEDLTAVTAGE